ncbi:MAG TPA: Nif3-like dinuclear metal center hexameric protein [Chitinophagaceae bacterium]
MKVNDVIKVLEALAPASYQENYDNAGLITGQPGWECSGILCSLDVTEEVVREANARNCNMIVAHHPIIFSGLKKINGKNYVEKAVIAAIKMDIAIYAIHTNLDNTAAGVNGKIAEKIGLGKLEVLAPKENHLRKLYAFVPEDHAGAVRDAIFATGAGHIGNYSECSFNIRGKGTFKAGEGADPYLGEVGKRHQADEVKIEVIFPAWLQSGVISALLDAHPYEEVAYDIIPLGNYFKEVGSGLVGELPEPMEEVRFLYMLKTSFGLTVIRHTPLRGRPVKRVAVCGGAGSFLIRNALSMAADVYVTADVKYHEFFDAEGEMVIADIGHFESEQFTTDLLIEILQQKFPTFAVLKTTVNTNPVRYFAG